MIELANSKNKLEQSLKNLCAKIEYNTPYNKEMITSATYMFDFFPLYSNAAPALILLSSSC